MHQKLILSLIDETCDQKVRAEIARQMVKLGNITLSVSDVDEARAMRRRPRSRPRSIRNRQRFIESTFPRHDHTTELATCR